MNTNKTRPGVYVNINAELTALTRDNLGVVAIPLALNWGAPGFTEIQQDQSPLHKLGYQLNDSAMLPVKLILKNAQTALVYRLSGGTKATGELAAGITATALYEGTRGNDISVQVKALETGYQISTYLDTQEMDVQVVNTAADFVANEFITIMGSGTLVDKTVRLSGATDTPAEADDYDSFLAAAKIKDFNIITCTSTDQSIKNKIVDFVKAERAESHLMQAVLENMRSDNEAVISVKNGFVLDDGTVVTAQDACAYVAGASAAAGSTQSLTFAAVDGAVDCSPRLTDDQIKQAILDGQLVFSVRRKGIVIEYDINTLVTYNQKPKDYRKNKVIRVIDAIHSDVISIYETNYIGQVQNNKDGRNLLKGTLAEYLNGLQTSGAIEDFDAAEDIQVEALTDKDSVHIQLAVKPTDTVDKIYIDVEVQ